MRNAFLLLTLTTAACGASDGNASFGGAQDIGEFRSILDRGELPSPNTLDANGFFNEHYNAPAPADCGKSLCLTPGLASGYDWLTGGKQVTLQLAVSTPVDPTTYQRPPMDLVVVVDHSGSMSQDNRLEKVKVGLHTLIDGLLPEDRLAIVSFDDDVVIDAAFPAELDRSILHARVDALRPDGGTNIYSGLDVGFAQLSGHDKTHQQRVILLSDGLATAGNTSRDAIIDMASTYVRTGIGLTTIGVGTDFDVGLMRGLAEHGAGNFYFLEDATAANEVFAQELDYFLVPLALDITITANAGSSFNFGEVVGTKLWSGETRNGTARIPAAFLASRTSQTGEPGRRGGGSMIFIQMIPTTTTFTDKKIGDFVMSYRTPSIDGTGSELVTQTLTLDYSDDGATQDNPYLSTPEMAERYAMYNVFLGLRYATHEDMGCAKAALLATRDRATAWNTTHQDPDLQSDITIVDQYIANINANGGNANETSLTACGMASDPYYPNDDYDNYDDNPQQYGCYSVGKASNAAGGFGFLLVGLALRLARRPRR